MEWIKTQYRLPEYGKGVLICLSNGQITVGYRKEKNIGFDWQLFGDIEGSLVVGVFDYVEYWMPLPKPPCDGTAKNSTDGKLPIFDVSEMLPDLEKCKQASHKYADTHGLHEYGLVRNMRCSGL